MKLNPIRQSLIAALSISVIGAAAPALAYDKGDTIVRGGIASVVPGGSYSSVAGGKFDLRADSDIQAGASISYMMTDNMSVNLLAATPFEHDIEASGGTNIGSTKHLPPTVTVSWFPLAGQDLGFKPYVGAGVNYTTFWDEKLNSTGKGATKAQNLSLDDSVGLAAQVGVDVPLDENWSVGAAAYYANIETDAELDGNGIGTVEIDPMIYRLHVGYSF
ncbi:MULTISPECIES: OmpW/AlkL family protein [Halomonadaceae]|uniref:Outer membrane beta-barrel protein n=1 Tax=Vreelandella halophila TaxID=86177 RepID=A0A9X4YDE3_9GAMM|nr:MULTISPECIES: OmpW family outer membrane protein [Halomonas]MYL27243.1 outer membrane beta-barrel protein [Halomonas utahensis]MYL74445.1 outer membrane beta-barrel protein [Halomonas sp. 22501_18_FS]